MIISVGFVHSQNYLLSPSFGTNGVKIINFPSQSEAARDMIRLSGNRMLISSAGNPIRTTRISANCGEVDSAYGFNGLSSLSYEWDQSVNSMTEQPDGKILTVGYMRINNAGSQVLPVICRINPDGSPDSSFADNGRYNQRFDDISSGEFYTSHVLPDGRILAVGQCRGNINGGQAGIGMMRFKYNGELDSTFGMNGKKVINIANGNMARGLLLPNGELIVSCGLLSGGNFDYLWVARIDSTGNLITSWGTDGIAQTGIGVMLEGSYPFVQPDGKIVVVGENWNNGAEQLFTTRFNTNGTIDTTYGQQGVSVSSFADGFRVYGVTHQADGKFLIAGKNAGGGGGPQVTRYNSNGTLDSTFANNGLYVFSMVNINPYLFAKAIEDTSDNSIVVSGQCSFIFDNDILMIKLIPEESQEWVYLGDDLTVCAGTEIILNPSTSGEIFLWNNGAVTPTLSPEISGEYAVTVTDQIGCSLSDTVQVTINPQPDQPVISQNGNELSTTTTGILQWYLNNVAITGATGTSVTAEVVGSYTVEVTTSGCSNISDAFLTVGIETLATNSTVVAYPNPVTDVLTLSGIKGGRTILNLIDISGSVVLTRSFEATDYRLDLIDIAPGIYFIQLINNNNVRNSKITKAE